MSTIQSASSGASTGATIGSIIPGVGTAIGAVVGAVIGAAAGGSGKVPATLAGFNVTGQFGRGGFTGNVTASSQKGDRWNPSGENSYLNSIGRGIVQFTSSTRLDDSEIDAYFDAGGAPIDVNVSTGPDNATLARSVGDSIIATLRGRAASTALINQLTQASSPTMAIQAPEITGAQPAGTPTMGQSSPQGPSTVTVQNMPASVSQLLGSPIALAALGLLVYLVMKRSGSQ